MDKNMYFNSYRILESYGDEGFTQVSKDHFLCLTCIMFKTKESVLQFLLNYALTNGKLGQRFVEFQH